MTSRSYCKTIVASCVVALLCEHPFMVKAQTIKDAKSSQDALVAKEKWSPPENGFRSNGNPPLFPVEKEKKWGYIDRVGRVVIAFQYDWAEPFADGLAAVMVESATSPGYTFGYIDDSGKIAVTTPLTLQGLRSREFHEGLAVISQALYGFMDEAGRIRIPLIYRIAREFSGGLACVYDGMSWYFIDKDGHAVFSEKYDEARSFSDGLAAVKTNGKWGFIDAEGAMVISPQFEDVGEFSDGLAAVRLGSKWGFIDKVGTMQIIPQFVGVKMFSEGLAAAMFDLSSGDRWGFIDKTGDIVIKPSFMFVLPFSDGRALVSHTQPSDFVAHKPTDTDTGFIDTTGTLIIPYQFVSASRFMDGLARVQVKSASGDLITGYIDTDGKYVWPR